VQRRRTVSTDLHFGKTPSIVFLANPPFLALAGKNNLHIRILAAFSWSGWGKLSGEIHLDLKGLAGQ
jgi:hypothetical protein